MFERKSVFGSKVAYMQGAKKEFATGATSRL